MIIICLQYRPQSICKGFSAYNVLPDPIQVQHPINPNFKGILSVSQILDLAYIARLSLQILREVIPSRAGSWPCPQILDRVEKPCQEQTH